ncbi:MAG: PaaI family thioesterase [Solirubrobacterales bacterium]
MSERPASPFDDLIGTEWGEMGAERATGTLTVEDRHKQIAGVVHGGVFCTLAESITSEATAGKIQGDGNVSLGMSNQTTFLRPVTGGSIHVRARRLHGGRTTWVWDVECRDDEDRLCAVSRVTIAVRPRRASKQAG